MGSTQALLEAEQHVVRGVIIEMLSIGGVLWFNRSLRDNEVGSTDNFDKWDCRNWLALCAILISAFHASIKEIILFFCYRRWSWTKDYFDIDSAVTVLCLI